MPQIADRKSMARYICVDKGATHPAFSTFNFNEWKYIIS